MDIIIDYSNWKQYACYTHPNVETIICIDITLEQITQVLSCVPNLFSLEIRGTVVNRISDIGSHPQLHSLYLNHNCLQSLKGLDLFPNLRVLECENNKLTSLDGIQYCPHLVRLNVSRNALVSIKAFDTQVWYLDCSYNHLQSLVGIDGCSELRHFNCSGNRLVSIDELGLCPNLINIDCSHNSIETAMGIRLCSKLSKLNISNNCLQTIRYISQCPSLTILNCCRNWLTSLRGLGRCPLLTELDTSCNNLTTIIDINRCSLTKFWCQDNKLTELGAVTSCTQLTELDIIGNYLHSISSLVHMMPNLRNARFRDHEIGSYTDYFYGSFADEYTRHKAKTVYEDKQNVHDTSVQQSVCDSIKRLCTDPKPAFTIEMLVQADIDADVIETIRVFGRDGTRHSICGLTYVELLGYVWQRIEQHESRSELYRVLQQQVRESCDVCFTGRFNRLLSVLVGFSEDITITISDQAQIAAVILAIKARVDPYNSNTHADLARTELLDLGYSSEDTQPWLDAITSQ